MGVGEVEDSVWIAALVQVLAVTALQPILRPCLRRGHSERQRIEQSVFFSWAEAPREVTILSIYHKNVQMFFENCRSEARGAELRRVHG